MTRIVIHLWTDITDDDSRTALARIQEAVSDTGYECALEHHAFPIRHSTAHEFIYVAKGTGATLEDAAQAGMTALERLGRAHDAGQNIDDPDTLARLCPDLDIDPEQMRDKLAAHDYQHIVDTDRADADRMRAEAPPLVIMGGIVASQGVRTAVEYRSMLDQVAETLQATETAAAQEAEEIRRAGRAE